MLPKQSNAVKWKYKSRFPVHGGVNLSIYHLNGNICSKATSSSSFIFYELYFPGFKIPNVQLNSTCIFMDSFLRHFWQLSSQVIASLARNLTYSQSSISEAWLHPENPFLTCLFSPHDFHGSVLIPLPIIFADCCFEVDVLYTSQYINVWKVNIAGL